MNTLSKARGAFSPKSAKSKVENSARCKGNHIRLNRSDKLLANVDGKEEGVTSRCEAMEVETAECTTEGQSAEAQKPKFPISPPVPSKREREEHEILHMPYRSWCDCCVRGRGVDSPHQAGRVSEELIDKDKPHISMDYEFPGG